MDNNQRPKFDPETGRPLEQPTQPAQPTEPPRPRFDPETGRPLEQPMQTTQPTEPPRPRFDPETGRPLEQPMQTTQPQRLDTPTASYIPPQPGQNYTGGTVNPEPPRPTHAPFNGLALASLICGVLSLLCCCCGWPSIILGIAGVVLAIVSKRGEKMSGMALGGMICGIIGAVIALIGLIFLLVLSASGAMDNLWHETTGANFDMITPESAIPGYDYGYDFYG